MLGYVWTHLMFLMSFIVILRGWVHRVHSTSTTYLLRRGSKSLYFIRRFEFLAFAKIVRTTITFFSVCLFSPK